MKNTKKATGKKHRILLVDDHPIVRQGVRLLVSQEPDMEVCGEAESASQALQVAEEQKPDLAVVDLSLKDSSGLELIKDFQIRYPDLRVVVLSMRDESFYAERVLRAGARGYITKERGIDRVIEGIRKVLAGEVYLDEKLAARMISSMVRGPVETGPDQRVRTLTDRELQVFDMVGRGLTTREIAAKLHLSIKTIESHREHIKEKLQLDGATDLLRHAIQWVQSQEEGG